MIYRTHGRNAGALGYFMSRAPISVDKRVHVNNGPASDYTAVDVADHQRVRTVVQSRQTTLATRTWCACAFPIEPAGWDGAPAMEVRFFDGSGEELNKASNGGAAGALDRAFGHAKTMISAPLWAALPTAPGRGDGAQRAR
jgi:hypothetical protein